MTMGHFPPTGMLDMTELFEGSMTETAAEP